MGEEAIQRLVCDLGAIILPPGWMLTCAESCTGGLLASSIIANTKVSGAFERGFVVYSVDAKCELLGLERKRVEECGGVAEDIALSMARAALNKSKADLAAAVTGFAGPQESDEEVGLVYLAAASRAGVRSKTLRLGDIGRTAVCSHSAAAALELLIQAAGDLAKLDDRISCVSRNGVR